MQNVNRDRVPFETQVERGEEALDALTGPQSASTEPAFESETDDEDDMPDLIDDEVISPVQPGQWSYSLTDSGQSIEICDLTGVNIQFQVWTRKKTKKKSKKQKNQINKKNKKKQKNKNTKKQKNKKSKHLLFFLKLN